MSKPRVLVIGCGFGGIEAVRALSASRADIEIVLVDRTNHHLFQPLLYQVATAGLSAPAISGPIRHILRPQMQRGNLTILQGEVVDVLPHQADDANAGGQVVLADGEHLPYNHLIVAAGATHSYFGRDDWARHAPGLKTLADAFEIRQRVVNAFEQAERCQDPTERAAWLTFVVIGAGPTGVEMAGTLSEMARHTLVSEFRRIDSRQARVILLEGSPRVLGSFVPELSARAADQLHKLGVEVRTGCRVNHIDEHSVRFEEGNGGDTSTLACRTVVWAAGVAASKLGQALARSTGVSLDRAGRVQVQPDLSLPGHPNISVIGDLACARSYRHAGQTESEAPLVPGVSPAAKQMGRLAAANVLNRLQGRATQVFRYADYGSLATIGRKAAVVDLGRLRFSGYFAWLFWLFAHIYFLIGFRNRLVVLIDWAWAYWTFERNARVVAQPASE